MAQDESGVRTRMQRVERHVRSIIQHILPRAHVSCIILGLYKETYENENVGLYVWVTAQGRAMS